MNYYGIDWLAMLLTVMAIYLLGNKVRSGLVLMTLGNICWVTMGVLTDGLAMILAMILANLIFLTMNVRGWFKCSVSASS